MGKQWDKGNFCTLAPDRIFNYELSGACYIHDVHYMEKNVSRLEADIQLRENLKAVSNSFIAWVYYLAVRLFGSFYY